MARPLTEEERWALWRLAARNGRFWKRELRTLWDFAVTRTDDQATLYTLRNAPDFGVRWLLSVQPRDFEPTTHPEVVAYVLAVGNYQRACEQDRPKNERSSLKAKRDAALELVPEAQRAFAEARAYGKRE